MGLGFSCFYASSVLMLRAYVVTCSTPLQYVSTSHTGHSNIIFINIFVAELDGLHLFSHGFTTLALIILC